MARVNHTVLTQYPILPYTSLRKPFVFVVDMVNGFLKLGNLHDKEISKIIEPIQILFEKYHMEGMFIVDEHEQEAREFMSFPLHCVIHSQESAIIDELAPFATNIIKKNSTNTFVSKQFQERLSSLDSYEDIVITGCCTDICILQFALCLNSWMNEHNKKHQRIILPLDCIDTYHIESLHDAVKMNEFSIRLMEASGIYIVQKIVDKEDNEK